MSRNTRRTGRAHDHQQVQANLQEDDCSTSMSCSRSRRPATDVPWPRPTHEERVLALTAKDAAEAAQTRAGAVKDFGVKMLESADPVSAGSMNKELMKLVLSDAAADVGEEFVDHPLLEAGRRLLGDDHPDTLLYIENMGNQRLAEDSSKEPRRSSLRHWRDLGGFLGTRIQLHTRPQPP